MSLLKRKKEFNVFEKSPLYRYVSREIDDNDAVYDILGPLYIKNRMNFLDLFPDVRKMIIECNDLMKEKTENSDIYEPIRQPSHPCVYYGSLSITDIRRRLF